MTRARAGFLMLIVFACWSGLAAQVTPASARSNDPTAVLKSKLRQLVTAQENYWMGHGTYTTDVAALGMYSQAIARSDSIWVQVVQAGGRSWWGRSSTRAHRDKGCAIFIGITEDFSSQPATDAAKVKAQREGEPICDP